MSREGSGWETILVSELMGLRTFVGIYSILHSPHQPLDSGYMVHELESGSRGLIVSRQHNIPPSPRLEKKRKGAYIYWETSVSSTLTDAISITSIWVFVIRLIQISCYNKQPPNISGLAHCVCFLLTAPPWTDVSWVALPPKVFRNHLPPSFLALVYCDFPVAVASL